MDLFNRNYQQNIFADHKIFYFGCSLLLLHFYFSENYRIYAPLTVNFE